MSRWDKVLAFVGEIARPFCLIVSAGSSGIATVSIVWMKLDLITGAAFITAAWAGTVALYGAKALETASGNKEAAKVEIAKNAAG